MCRTLHLDKLGMLNQTLGSIRNSDYNLLDEETKQLANKLYDSLSKKLPKQSDIYDKNKYLSRLRRNYN